MSNLTELKKQYKALGKEIKKIEDSPFVPGWYMYWDNDQELYHIEYIKTEHVYKGAFWDNIVPVTQELLNKFLPKMYDWSKAPDWAQWAATDADGNAFWYHRKPEKSTPELVWFYTHVSDEVMPSSDILRYTSNWEDSLEERPEGAK